MEVDSQNVGRDMRAVLDMGVRIRNGNLSTVRSSSLQVDWSPNAFRRSVQPHHKAVSLQYPFCRKTSGNRVLECFFRQMPLGRPKRMIFRFLGGQAMR
jgi:hypothetical protein